MAVRNLSRLLPDPDPPTTCIEPHVSLSVAHAEGNVIAAVLAKRIGIVGVWRPQLHTDIRLTW